MGPEDVRLSLAVIHGQFEPRRRMLLFEQTRRLGGLSTIQRETVDYFVSADTTRAGCWPTVRRAWQAGLRAPGATHHLVLSDDAFPVRNLLPAVKRAIAVKPEEALSPINFRPTLGVEARATGKSWATAPDGIYGVAMILPTKTIAPFLRWVDENIDPSYVHDDRRLIFYLEAFGRPAWMMLPCLVEHYAANESLMGHGGIEKHRRACYFRGYDFDGLEVDWTIGADDPIRHKHYVKFETAERFMTPAGRARYFPEGSSK